MRYLVCYDKLTTVFLKGMQEQQAQINALKVESNSLKSENINIKSVIDNKADAADLEKIKAEINYMKDVIQKAEK
jgi:hypothetical protein